MRRFLISIIALIIIGIIFTFASPFPHNNYKKIFTSNLDNIEKYDVIVIGSEPEGITAAVAAARSGAKTLLLGEEENPGGIFTYAMLNTLDLSHNPNGDLLTRGIFSEFYKKIGNKTSFDVERAQNAFLELIENEKNLTYLPKYKFISTIVKENKAIGVKMVNSKNTEKDFIGSILIDATQDGDVTASSQDLVFGSSAEDELYFNGMNDFNMNAHMATTLVFKVGGVDWEQLKSDINNYKNEMNDINAGITKDTAWGFGKLCYDKYTPIYKNMRLRGPNIGLQENGTVLINALQILDVNAFDEASKNKAMLQGEEEAQNAVKYLKTIIPAFKNAYFDGVAKKLYTRESRHIRGEYLLTVTDILENTNFSDKIALSSYPIDIQSININNDGYVIGNPITYSIPLRCIIPQKVDNILIVGKSASYTSASAGSARVVPTGMVVGESAGITAAYSLKNNITPRELSQDNVLVYKLLKVLKQQGVYLPEFEYKSSIQKVKGYNQIKKLVDLGFISGGYNNNFRFEENVKVSSFITTIVNALQRAGKEKYNIETINRLNSNYSEIRLDSIKAGRIIASLFGKDLSDKTDDEAWNIINKEGYFDDEKEEIEKGELLTRRQIYILTVNNLEKLLGRELK